MSLIDRYAYSNALRKIDPLYKGGVVLLFIVLCLVLNEPQVGLTAALWMFLLAVALARIPWRVFAGILFGELAFLFLATLAVVLSVSIHPPALNDGWALPLGPLWIVTSQAALNQGASLIFRALGAAAAMNFLALTTPMLDIIQLFHRLRLPSIFIDLMTLMYRFIFVLLESLHRMVRAQDSRLGFAASNWRRMQNTAWIATHLFMESFLRSRRLQLALASRGYDGSDLRVLPSHYEKDVRFLVWCLSGTVVLLLVWRLI